MSYQEHFTHADEVIATIKAAIPGIHDPLAEAKFIGFVSVAAVTVYEQAIKSIFIDFGEKKHKVMGHYVRSQFDRINGRIKYKTIKDEYVLQFGTKYRERFKQKITQRTKDYLGSYRRDILSSYDNIITWRNDFAHEGKINTTATLNEVVSAYEDGKEIIHCLAETMRR
uniref:RiboL-PSP-HEPN domain-containing protein n=1 Tax=Candidatus Kentrum sp. SD TaxID=2126332 RepID=A0A451BI54_9GAMM|nr:MAG: hypothetical protein BECKSD772D_GA0070982_100442 [Candidatus Kentron sp. SD]